MGERPIKLGSMTLLMTIVLLCMAVLAMLTISTANADLNLARNHARHIQEVYEMDSMGQELLGKIDKAVKNGANNNQILSLLPEGSTMENNKITIGLLAESGQTLNIILEIKNNTANILQWKSAVEWTPDETMDGLWGTQK